MKLDVYVNCRGNCEEAFRYYEEHLGGKGTSWLPLRQPQPTK